MIGEALRHQLLHWISRVVYIQVALVGGISILTFMLLVFRQWRSRKLTQWNQIYGDLLVEELMLNMEGQKALLLPTLSNRHFIRKTSLQNTLLSQIRSINGVEKFYLVKRYFELGFVKSDIVLCSSWFWWQRLYGVSNLRVLASNRLSKVYGTLKRDKNELVAAAANLALSELQHELNQIKLDELLPLLRQGRQSNLVEITSNWCQVHGFEPVFNLSCAYPEIELRNALLLAMLSVRTPESSQLMTHFLADAHYESPELVAEIIRSLRESGDPDSLSVVLEYAHHPDARVQARAIEYILEFLPDERREELRVLEVDPSAHVQRLMQTWSNRKVA